MSKLKEGQTLRREIHVYGVEGPVELEISTDGLRFHVKGSRKYVAVAWAAAVRSGATGVDVPSFLANKPLDLLAHEAKKVSERRKKRLTNN